MKVNFTTVSKVFLIGFAVSNFSHLLSLLGIHETLVHAPSYLSFWWWHAILFLAYAVLPLSAVLIGHAVFCLLVTSVSLVGILIASFRVLSMLEGLHFVFLFLYSFAAILSLSLAVENVSLKVAAERLSLERSQFQ
jgi:hypothetical protein